MNTIQKKALSVGKYVNSEHVDSIIRTYKKEKWLHNSKRLGKPDSLSVWYSVEELECFIANSKKNGADGIKLSFAAYPENHAPLPEYEGLQTIVLVATKKKKSANGISDKNIYVTKNGSTEILAYNAGKLCPPYCAADFTEIGVTLIDKGEDGLAVI